MSKKKRNKFSLEKLNADPIRCIKHTRCLMMTLKRLGLKTPDHGLKVCKFYFDRCREKAGFSVPRNY